MGCGELFKHILFCANLAFALAGLTLLGLGIAVQLKDTDIVQIADFNRETSMVVGSIVVFIAFIVYSISMLLLMIVKLTFAILIFKKLDDVVAEVPRWLTEAFSRDRIAFQTIEHTFTCCGPNGAMSYLPSPPSNTCCAKAPCLLMNSYSGCSGIVQEFFHTFGIAIGYATIVIVSIEYSISMLLLMIVKLTFAILIFEKLDDVVAEVPRWLIKLVAAVFGVSLSPWRTPSATRAEGHDNNDLIT